MPIRGLPNFAERTQATIATMQVKTCISTSRRTLSGEFAHERAQANGSSQIAAPILTFRRRLATLLPSISYQLQLQQIIFSDLGLEIIWKQRTVGSERDESKDPPNKSIDGDEYEYHAFRVIPARSVMRFLIQPDKQIAALFIQLPLGREHSTAFTDAETLVKKLFGLTELHRLKMSKAIKTLDSLDLTVSGRSEPDLEAHRTKFTSSGAAVEFSADSTLTGWKQVTSVRRVRKSMRAVDFEGESGSFNVHLLDMKGMKRTIQMAISGKRNRIYFRAQMTANEILSLLSRVEESAR